MTTISFNTSSRDEEKATGGAGRGSVVPEPKHKGLMKKKLIQHTRTGVQSPKITTQTAGEKGKEPAVASAKSPVA